MSEYSIVIFFMGRGDSFWNLIQCYSYEIEIVFEMVFLNWIWAVDWKIQ